MQKEYNDHAEIEVIIVIAGTRISTKCHIKMQHTQRKNT
jgi:hypothetical protein